MKNNKEKRFAIIGLPGSGKSTFAAKLGAQLNIPVYHLDNHMFEPAGKKRDKQEFIKVQKNCSHHPHGLLKVVPLQPSR